MDLIEFSATPIETPEKARPDHVELAVGEVVNAIAKYCAELRERITRAEAYAPEVMIAADFVRAFPSLCGDSEYEWDRPLRIALSLDPGCVNALMLNLDALRLADVAEPLKWLAQRLGKYVIDDYPEIGRRAYVFKNDGREVRFQVFFNKGESVCKFVQVGVKEEPVYKLMCGEQEVTGEGA